MSFGTLFTLRQRARGARPGAADEAFPETAGWIERRESKADRRGSRREASGRRAADRGPKPGVPR